MTIGLEGRRVAILATDGVEQVELVEPRKALDAAGAETQLVSLKPGSIQAYHHLDKGDTFEVDATVDEAMASQFDALFIPGGVANPDAMRMNPRAVQFVREFMVSDKPVAAICHAAWSLVEAGVLEGRTITSWPSIQTDVRNAGATWVDEEVVVDGNLITSRKPDDLKAFNATLLEALA